MKPINIITILGPTAAGKTRVAALLADTLNGEVISADSRQVYRDMTIGTGKDLDDYRVGDRCIPTHLVDIRDAGEHYTLFDFQQDARTAITDIDARNKRPILCGGTGLYLSALLEDYQLPGIPPSPERHAELNAMDTDTLVERLSQHGPLHNTTDTEDRNRLIRAIEIAESDTPPAPPFPLNSTTIGIRWERETLRSRITERLNHRLKNGMIEEVKDLLNKGISPEELNYYGLEYRYVTCYLTGDLNRNDMTQKLRSAIHQFAKRQETWFRRMERRGIPIHWVEGSTDSTHLCDRINTAIMEQQA